MLFGGNSLTTSAQTITLNSSASAAANATALPTAGSPGYACVNYSATSPLTNEQTLVFTPGANNEVVDKWIIQGEATASSGYSSGMNGNTFKFYPTGFGKARITVSYYYDNGSYPVYCSGGPLLCNGQQVTQPIRSYASKSFDFFKTFTMAQAGFAIKGPTCVPINNPSVVYTVDPPVISTVNQIRTGIDIDTYEWQVQYADNNANVPFAQTGDGSSIIIQGREGAILGDITRSFNVRVKVGKCNSYTSNTLVTVAPNINGDIGAGTSPVAFPACLPITTTTTSTNFTLLVRPNVDYTLTSSVGTISPTTIAAGTGGTQTITISGIGATASGLVTITGVGNTGSCFGTQSFAKRLDRQLVTTINTVSPSCVSANANTTFTLASAPTGGETVTWNATGTGWYVVSQTTSSAVIHSGAGTGTVTVQAGSCATITKSVGISAPLAGCTFDIVNSGGTSNPGCGFTASVAAGSTCPTNNANKFVKWRLYDLSTSPRTLIETVDLTSFPALQNSPSVSFSSQLDFIGTAQVEVDVVNTATGGSCLKDTYKSPDNANLDFVHCPTGGRSTLGTSTATASERDGLRAYPNPAGGTLQVDITLPRGTAKLTLLDAVGRVYHTSTTDKAHSTLDVSRLAEGIYMLQVQLPGGKVVTQSVQVKH